MSDKWKDRPPVRQAGRPNVAPEVHAAEHLRYIRDIMERSGSFTAVPGWGSIAMGMTAIGAAVVASFQQSPEVWLGVWMAEAIIAVIIGSLALVRKARVIGVPLRSGAGRKYVLSLVPSMIAGVLLTCALWRAEEIALLPGLWLLVYGAGTVTGGAFSVRAVPLTGFTFMLLGAVALLSPFTYANWFLAAGFGGIHIVFGWIIAKHYGG